MRPPNAEQVGVAWISGLAGLADLVRGVSNTLPLLEPGVPQPVYVQVTVPGGMVNRYSPVREPIVQVDAWAAEGLLNEVFTASEIIRDATYDGSGIGDVATYQGFSPVALTDVSVFSEPRLIRGDPAALARASQMLVLAYTVKE